MQLFAQILVYLLPLPQNCERTAIAKDHGFSQRGREGLGHRAPNLSEN